MVYAKDLHDLVIQQLVGAKIVRAIIDPDEEFTGFTLEMPDGTRKTCGFSAIPKVMAVVSWKLLTKPNDVRFSLDNKTRRIGL